LFAQAAAGFPVGSRAAEPAWRMPRCMVKPIMQVQEYSS
jgi:hypothetical protein